MCTSPNCYQNVVKMFGKHSRNCRFILCCKIYLKVDDFVALHSLRYKLNGFVANFLIFYSFSFKLNSVKNYYFFLSWTFLKKSAKGVIY